MSEKVVLGYWGIRGLAQVARLLLAYTGAVWENVVYSDRAQWFEKDKTGLGIEFANLPYLIEGDFKLTESKAIYNYIINRSNKKELLGKNPKEQARIEQILNVTYDSREPISKLFFDKDWEKNLPETLEKVAAKLDALSKFYGDKEFALGFVTLADFMLAETSFYIEKVAPEFYAKYPFLQRTRQALEALPEIKKYYEQPTSIKGPFIPK